MPFKKVTADDIAMKRWAVVVHRHVVPVGDEFIHTYSTDCLCKPKVESVPDGNGYHIVKHNAYDGRD